MSSISKLWLILLSALTASIFFLWVSIISFYIDSFGYALFFMLVSLILLVITDGALQSIKNFYEVEE